MHFCQIFIHSEYMPFLHTCQEQLLNWLNFQILHQTTFLQWRILRHSIGAVLFIQRFLCGLVKKRRHFQPAISSVGFPLNIGMDPTNSLTGT
ncbi:unnamed protein product [Paramecium octaurelia]|uniref:Uncharacterized protein n=1 Tax=Paramecium octaurelia TaxID=43137 RepID=A0A8S1X6K0_PAROT|nr:unnamed protein product [Paramecium octaurelia]